MFVCGVYKRTFVQGCHLAAALVGQFWIQLVARNLCVCVCACVCARARVCVWQMWCTLGQACWRVTLSGDPPLPSPPFDNSEVMVIVWRLRGNIIRTVSYIANVLPLQWAQLTKTVHTARLGLEFVLLCFLGCMICLYVGVCFVLPWIVESFPFMLWRWRNKLKWAPFELFAPSSLLWVRSWLHPFKGHCEQKAMRDEGVVYVAGHPLLNRRCTRLPGCFCFPKRKL